MPMLGEIEALPIGCKTHAEALAMKDYYFRVMGYEWHAPEVKAFHESDAPIRIVTAPARGSKSFSAAPEVVAAAMPTDPLTSSLSWLVGVDYPTNKEFQYVFQYLVEQRERWLAEPWGKCFKIQQALNNPSNGSMRIVIDWGKSKSGERCRAIIEGKSATNERALQGEHVSMGVLSEAAEHDQRIWTKYLSTRTWKMIAPTTPKPKAKWLRQMILDGQRDPSLGIESFKFSKEANPLYNHAAFIREEKMASSRSSTGRAEDDPFFAEQFLGRWALYTGMVLPFNASRHVVKLEEHWLDHCKLFVSTDYGYEDACVAGFWAQMPSGALLLWDEIYERHLTTPEFVQAINDKLGDRREQLDYVCGDPKQPQVAEYMARYGLNVINVNKQMQADRAVGHRRLVDLLSDDPERGNPSLYVAEQCKRTIAEWESLCYREGFTNEYGTNQMQGDDHAFDMARYMVTTLPEPAREKPAEDWQRWQKQQLANDRRSEHRSMRSGGHFMESC